MPEVSARSRSSESARMRLPSSVSAASARWRRGSTKPTRITISWVRPIRRPGTRPWRAVDVELAQLGAPDELDPVADTNASPSVISSSCSIPAPRVRIGAHIVFSRRIPSSAVVAIANAISEHQRQVPGDVDQVGHVGAEGEEVAVGEVDQLEDSVDEGEADGAERVDRAEREAVEAALRDVVRPW